MTDDDTHTQNSESDNAPYGLHRAGELARWQLESLRRDPRLDREEPAVIAEFYESLFELCAYRMTMHQGAFRLRDEVSRVEQEGADSATAQAAWEMADTAGSLIDTDFPLLNAWSIAHHVFALDALVEELAPSFQEMMSGHVAHDVMRLAREQHPDLVREVEEVHGDEVWDVLAEAVAELALADQAWPGRPAGIGVARYEKVLRRAHMWPLPDLPADLTQALAEAHTIRNVVVHRGGFVDQRAHDECPGFPYPAGQLLRLTWRDSKRYSAAVRTFAGVLAPVDGPPSLDRWQDNALLGY